MRSGPETYGPTIENTKNPTQQHLKAIWQRSTCLLNYLQINSHNRGQYLNTYLYL